MIKLSLMQSLNLLCSPDISTVNDDKAEKEKNNRNRTKYLVFLIFYLQCVHIIFMTKIDNIFLSPEIASIQKGVNMLRDFMIAKIHRARVTQRDPDYVGSITIDEEMMLQTGILENQRVYIYNISNGHRFSTYVIKGERGSGIIGINGAAARLASIHDKVIIVAYAMLNDEEVKNLIPQIVVVEDEENKDIKKISG